MKMCYFPVTTIPIWQSVYVPFNRTHQLAGFITKHSCTFVVPLWNQPIISKGELLKRKEMLLQLNAEGWNSSRLNISKWSFWTVFEDEQTKHHFWVPHEVQGIWNAKNLQLGHKIAPPPPHLSDLSIICLWGGFVLKWYFFLCGNCLNMNVVLCRSLKYHPCKIFEK